MMNKLMEIGTRGEPRVAQGLSLPQRSVSAVTDTIGVDDYTLIADTASNAVAFSLPTAVGFDGQSYVIRRVGASAASVVATGGQTIDGSASPVSIANATSLCLQSDGANWFTVFVAGGSGGGTPGGDNTEVQYNNSGVFGASPNFVYVSPTVTLKGTAAADTATLGAEFITGGSWTSVDWTGNNSAGWYHPVGTIETITLGTTGSGGSGYSVGDLLSVTTGGTGGIVKVATLSGDAVATFELMSAIGTAKGSGYTTGDDKATAFITGSGTGATVKILTINNVTPLSFSVAATSGIKYQIHYEIFSRTQGGVVLAFGDQTTGYANVITTTSCWGPTVINAAGLGLVVTPTSIFDGGIRLSIKPITAASTAIVALKDSEGFISLEMRESISTGNLAIGKLAGEYFTSGIHNTAVGTDSLRKSTTGDHNSALGSGSLIVNTVGYGNSAFGYNSLPVNVQGYENEAFGVNSLINCTSGIKNSAFGTNSGGSVGNAFYNSAFGYYSLCNKDIIPSSMSGNSAFGSYSLGGNIAGNNNCALGYYAGCYAADGTTEIGSPENSIYIGYFCKGKDLDDDNSVVIGYNAIGAGANTIVFGNDDITATYLKGSVAINGGIASAPNAKAMLDVASTTKGFLTPRMSATQRNAITSPPEGLELYNLTTHQKEYYNGSGWTSLDKVALVIKTAYYEITAADYIIIGDTATGFTVVLPTAVDAAGKMYVIKRMGVGTLSIDTTSSQTIDAVAAPMSITADKTSVTVVSDGANWLLI